MSTSLQLNPYRFPSNKRAEITSPLEQAHYVSLEAKELVSAIENNEGDMRAIEEAWDVIIAAEGVLRKYPTSKVLAGSARVRIKNQRRGDW